MKKLLIALTVLSVVFISAATITWVLCGESVEGILMGVIENAEEIEKQRNENQINLVNDVNTYMEVPIREFTEEEKVQIEQGEISVTDVYQKIFEEKKEETSQTQGVEKDSVISLYMTELYKLQNEYMAKAEATIKQGASFYESIKKHSHDVEARTETISKFTPVVRGLESECDSKVNALIKEMETELKKIGADTLIVSSVKSTYENEKKLKLSYYANKYLK